MGPPFFRMAILKCAIQNNMLNPKLQIKKNTHTQNLNKKLLYKTIQYINTNKN